MSWYQTSSGGYIHPSIQWSHWTEGQIPTRLLLSVSFHGGVGVESVELLARTQGKSLHAEDTGKPSRKTSRHTHTLLVRVVSYITRLLRNCLGNSQPHSPKVGD